MKASVIIVTRNRAADLAQTLQSMRGVRAANGLDVELLVVNNGSTDETAEVVRAFSACKFPLRHVYEERRGESYGRNRGLEETTGELIVFTDDDVRVRPDWVNGMCEPMLRNGVSVVAGGVMLAPNLTRPWMTHRHRSYLAATEWLRPDEPHGIVGANMAFSREVLRRVPAFDTELGPGALGFGDEELFSAQLIEAGFRIFGRLDVCVEHHFDPCRLKRASWLDAAAKRGVVSAYLTYHWHNRDYRLPRLRMALVGAKLMAFRALSVGTLPDEGCSESEMLCVFRHAELRHYLQERYRPRKYCRHGLVKISDLEKNLPAQSTK